MKYVTTDTLRVRATPSITGDVVAVLSKGTVVDSDQYLWKAVTINGVSGYSAATYLKEQGDAPTLVAVSSSGWHAPLDPKYFTPSSSNPYLNHDAETYTRTQTHPGTDYPVMGKKDVPLYVCADGEVIEKGSNAYAGNFFCLYIPSVDKTAIYFHGRDPITISGLVKAGTVAGTVGNTGLSFGEHLHIEVLHGKQTLATRSQLYTSKGGIIAAGVDAHDFITKHL